MVWKFYYEESELKVVAQQSIYSVDEIDTFREPTEEEAKKIYSWYEFHTEDGLKGFQLLGCIGLLIAIPCIVSSVVTKHFTLGTFFILILGLIFGFVGVCLFSYVGNHNKVKRAIKNKEYQIVEVELYKGEDDIINETALGYFKTLDGEEYSQPIRIVVTDMEIGSTAYLVYCPIARKVQLHDFVERVLTPYMLSTEGLKLSVIKNMPSISKSILKNEEEKVEEEVKEEKEES